MTTFDAHANLAVATVSPDSAVIGSTLGDTLIAESVEAAALFPAVPFNVTVWRDAAPEPGAAEIMRATAFDGHRTFTVLRGQEGTAPLAYIAVGWRFADTVTAGVVEAIEDALNAEEVTRAAADSAEATTRAAADAALGSALTAETAARTAGDATLQSEVTAETAARIAGDASTLSSSETYADGKVATEATARAAGDAATLSSAETYAAGEVAAEASTRAAADTTLQGDIDSEAVARIAGDAATLSTAETHSDAGDATTLAAAETYTDSKVVAAVHYRGAIDASSNPNLPAANLGDLYAISVAGTVSGIAVEAGDMAICKVNATPANTPANWDVIQTNINGAVTGPTSSTDLHFAQFNGATGKVIQDGGLAFDTDPTLAADSDARIASQKATKDYVDSHAVDGGTPGAAGQAVQVRRGTAAQWTAANPVLRAGEIGEETDTGLVKIGDGATAWAVLSYANAGTSPWLTLQAVFETFNREYFYVANIANDTSYTSLGLTSGRVRIAGARAAVLPKGKPVHSIRMHSGLTALSGGSHQWFCLVRQSDLTVLAVTADDGATAWAASSAKELVIAGGDYVSTTDVAVYIGCCVVATGMPTLLGMSSGSGPVLPKLDFAVVVPPYLGGQSTTGLTGPVAVGTVLATPPNQSVPFYAVAFGP